jgi:hypothetical protein
MKAAYTVRLADARNELAEIAALTQMASQNTCDK